MKKLLGGAYALALLLSASVISAAPTARAENAPGVTDTEIKIGQTMPESGPLASYGGMSVAEAAYFRMINDQGGINGRKLTLITLDDGFNPDKALELTRKLVEQEKVAFIFGSLGDPQNLAVRPYLNANKIPQLFIVSASDFAGDYKHYPWTIGGMPVFRIEAQIYARYISRELPDARVGVLFENDDFGQTYITGLKEGFGQTFDKHVVKEAPFVATDTTIAPQIAALKAAGATVLISAVQPSFAIKVLHELHDQDWHPIHIITTISASVSGVLKPGGLDNAKGVITALSYATGDDESLAPYRAFIAKYLSQAPKEDAYMLVGYTLGQAVVQVLKQCGDDFSRENIMKEAANLRDFHPIGLLPGVSFNTNRTKYLPIVEAALARFDGTKWVVFGDVMAGR